MTATIALVDDSTAEAKGRSKQIISEIQRRKQELSTLDKDTLAQTEHINQLKTDLSQLEKQNERLRADADQQKGENVREFRGDGDRQYLTGLKLGGKRILVLLAGPAFNIIFAVLLLAALFWANGVTHVRAVVGLSLIHI